MLTGRFLFRTLCLTQRRQVRAKAQLDARAAKMDSIAGLVRRRPSPRGLLATPGLARCPPADGAVLLDTFEVFVATNYRRFPLKLQRKTATIYGDAFGVSCSTQK